MRKMLVITAAMLLSFATATQVSAQMGGMSTGSAPKTIATPAQSADGMLKMFEGECIGAAKAMPADKYDFSPASLKISGAKYDDVRTFASEVKHIAEANYFFGMTLSGINPGVAQTSIESLKTKDEIVTALTNSFAFLHKANATLTPENSFEIVPFEGQKATRNLVAGFAVAHGFDHYGQMVEYLRMNGIVPPASAK